MGRASALIGLTVTLLWPAGAFAQVIDSTSFAARLELSPPRDSANTTLPRPQISPFSYDTPSSAYASQNSAQASVPPLDVSDRVQTVWVVKYR
jgi:hypothetical protein